MAKALKVNGLMNVQFAIQNGPDGDVVYVLEVNPRASRTVPFVSKATGLPLAKIAARCMSGESLKSQGVTHQVVPPYYSVKEAVFPFNKFPGVDPILGPEMKSTGEVMGVGETFADAFIKSQLAAGVKMPQGGKALISVRPGDKARVGEIASILVELGFEVVATKGTARAIREAGVEKVTEVHKMHEGRPNILDFIKNGDISFIVNTVDEDRRAILESNTIRIAALQHRITYYTTLAGARAACLGMKHMGELQVYDLQGLHKKLQ
jgi:carbamoyl-phosphate synthase large subunit